MTARRRVAVLISGRGSNMARLIEAAAERDFPAEVVGVVSDVADAAGLEFAARSGVTAFAVPRRDYASREAHEEALEARLQSLDADLVCLAGYMRVLSAAFVDRWSGRLLNIHPALLPAFPGLDTHRRALDAGVTIHGCTVHFVTAAVDSGPIVAQAALPVLTGDTETSLAARVLDAEHALYPLALRLVAGQKAYLVEDRVVFAELDDARHGKNRLFAPAAQGGAIDFEALARVTP